jgi:hypothetical protein
VPEEVFVLETVDTVERFIRAVERLPGMEWLGEIEAEDIPPDDDFFSPWSRFSNLSRRPPRSDAR